MTQANLRLAEKFANIGAICRLCRHDLEARQDGKVYCTNAACRHYRAEPHPTPAKLNRPD